MIYFMYLPIKMIFWIICSVVEWDAFRSAMRGSIGMVYADILMMGICVLIDHLLDRVIEEERSDGEDICADC